MRTVQLWVEAGVLPAWKTAGGHRRISRAAVQRLIGERTAALAGGVGLPEPARRPAEARLQVMVVEDDPEMLRLITMVITDWDLPLDVTPAGNGFEALLLMGQHCPDVLVTDLNMPGMDGFQMIASLRSVGAAFDDMDIVVVTALTRQEIERRGGLPAGVRVFHKPVPFDALEALVRTRITRLATTARGRRAGSTASSGGA